MAARSPISHRADWRVVHLGEIATKIGSGATPTGGEDSYLPERARYALVRSQNVFDRRFDSAGLAFISDEQASRLQGVVLKPNDLLLNITGDGVTFSRACLVPPDILPACVNQHVAIVRVDQSIADPGYVLSYLTHPLVKSYIESFNAGGSRRAITKGHIESFAIPLPSLPEQRAIARTLGMLDEKIELNGRMDGTLNAIARSLFRSWLVDFDPVRLQSEGRAQDAPGNIGILFPDSFQDSELGEIPAGWKVLSLDQVARFLNGLALQEYPPRGGDSLPVIKIAQLRAGNTGGADRSDADLDPAYIVNDGDVLFSWSGSLESVLWGAGRGALNQHLFKVTSAEYPKWFYYYWIHEHLEGFRRIAAGKATTMGHIQRHHLAEAKVVVPDEKALSKMDSILGPMVDRMVNLRIQSRTLSALRDALLPKLLSGEMRLLETPRLAEATT